MELLIKYSIIDTCSPTVASLVAASFTGVHTHTHTPTCTCTCVNLKAHTQLSSPVSSHVHVVFVCMASVASQAQKGNGSLSQAGILSVWSLHCGHLTHFQSQCWVSFELGVDLSYNTAANLRWECSSVAFEVCNVIVKLSAPFITNITFVLQSTRGYCEEYKNRAVREVETEFKCCLCGGADCNLCFNPGCVAGVT